MIFLKNNLPFGKGPVPTWYKVFAALFSMGGVMMLVLAFLFVTRPLQASGPSSNQVLNYQARLTDNNGIPLPDGAKNVKFVIFDALSGGNCEYTARGTCGTPTAKSVTVSNGHFSTLFGEAGDVAMPAGLFSGDESRFLEIQVETSTPGTYETLSPRKRIVSGPFAMNANLLDDLDTSAVGGSAAFVPVTDSSGNLTLTKDLSVVTVTVPGSAAPAVSSAGQGRIYFDSTSNTFKTSANGGAYSNLGDSGWVDDGTVVRLTTITDSVGIGTATPNFPLSFGAVTNSDKIALYDAGAGGSYGFGMASSTLTAFYPTAASFTVHTGGSSTGTTKMIVSDNGVAVANSTIGAFAPNSGVTLAAWGGGAIEAVATGGNQAFQLKPTGDLNSVHYAGTVDNDITFQFSGTEKVRVTSAGNVGIGSSTKLSRLTVTPPADQSNIGGTTTASVSTTIVGSGTTFLTSLGIGDRISLSSASTTYATVTAISSDTSLTVDTALGNGTSQTINKKSNIFRLDDASSATKFVVNDLGNVGIGLANPNNNANLNVYVSDYTARDWFRGTNNVGDTVRLYESGSDATVFSMNSGSMTVTGTNGPLSLAVNGGIYELAGSNNTKLYVGSVLNQGTSLILSAGAGWDTGAAIVLASRNTPAGDLNVKQLTVGYDYDGTYDELFNVMTHGGISVLGKSTTINRTASTEFIDNNFNSAGAVKTWATGAITTQRHFAILPPTYAFAGASTITNAATLAITGAPVAGTNATITNPMALWVQDGSVKVGTSSTPLSPSIYQGIIEGANARLALNGDSVSSLSYHIGGTQKALLHYAGNTWSLDNQGGSTTLVQFSTQPTVVFGSQGTRINTTGDGDVSVPTALTLEVRQKAHDGETPTALKVTGGAHINSVATTELTDINFALGRTVTFGTGGITTQRAVRITAPTYAFNGASTITNAATLAISGAPIAGTNATITNPYAFWVQGGRSRFDGDWFGIGPTLQAPFTYGETVQINNTGGQVGISLNSNPSSPVLLYATHGGSLGFSISHGPATTVVYDTPDFHSFRVSSSTYARLTNAGHRFISDTAGGDGAPTATLDVISGATSTGSHKPNLKLSSIGNRSNIESSTELNDVLFDFARTNTWNAGALATQRAFRISAPTYAFTGASTITNAATVAISGAPIAGTNATITNPYAFWVQGGNSRLDGTLSVPGAGAESERFGSGAAAGTAGVALGFGASAGASGTAIGYTTTATGQDGTAVGIIAGASGLAATSLGSHASAGGERSISIGYFSSAAQQASIALGAVATTAANQFVVGGSLAGYGISDAYFGLGVTHATPAAVTLNATGGSGTNIAGASLTLAGGKGTGNALGGSLIFQTSDAGASGTTLQTLTTKMTILPSGFVGIGTTLPASPLHVGVTTSGNNYTARFIDSNATAGANLVLGATVLGADLKYKAMFTDSNGLNFGRLTDALTGLPTAQMTITNGDNVVIGTTGASLRLQVHSTSTANSGIYVSSVAPNLQFGNNAALTSATQYGALGLATSINQWASNSAAGDTVLMSGGGKLHFATDSTPSVAGTIRMTIENSSGQVGIGTRSPLQTLDVRDSSEGSSGTISIGGNQGQFYGYYVDSSTLGGGIRFNNYNNSGDKYTRAGPASLLTWNGGVWVFNRASSGIADAAITYVTDLTIDGSGNVGINDASPDFKFDVDQASATVAGFNRTGNDGTIISLQQDGAEEGTISVSGNTVSYNAFTGSHYAWTDEDIQKGMLVMLTGDNKKLHDSASSEILYGVSISSKKNDSKIMGTYLSLQEPSKERNLDNPHLIMAVGNGDMWLTDEGGNIEAGDYLISSSTTGHAMKDDATSSISYIVARAAESIDWATVIETTADGQKHKRISVFFESFTRKNESIQLTKTEDLQTLTSDLNVNGKLLLNVRGIIGLAWSISEEGKLVSKEVEAEKVTIKNTETNRTIGVASFAVGQDLVRVENPAVTPASEMFITFKKNPLGTWWIEETGAGYFIIKLGAAATQETLFSYWVIGVDGEKLGEPTPQLPAVVVAPPVEETVVPDESLPEPQIEPEQAPESTP